jgi:hypothetical protein
MGEQRLSLSLDWHELLTGLTAWVLALGVVAVLLLPPIKNYSIRVQLANRELDRIQSLINSELIKWISSLSLMQTIVLTSRGCFLGSSWGRLSGRAFSFARTAVALGIYQSESGELVFGHLK